MLSSSYQRRAPSDTSRVPPPASRRPGPDGRTASSRSASSGDPGLQLTEQFALAWEEGRCKSAEAFFAQHPQACADPEIAARLVYEEFCLRREAGDAIDPEAILGRFPQWRSQLEVMLDFHELLQPRQAPAAFPSAGERLGEFQLLSELGRGAEGRVFLATQPSLSDRPVVVKLVPRKGREHLALARLQHASIVPLYFATDDAQRDLRVLCMPYVGGVSLAQLLEQLARVPVERRSGQHFVETLQQARAEAPVAVPLAGPALQFLPHASYVQAACWIGACLADALQYAHGRGLVHLDIKPSNVLLAGDGQPMLLDFHLAHEVVLPDCVTCDALGGTPGYMSPEQAQAIAAIGHRRPVPAAVDGRSDIYSLGLLLYELLGGPPLIAPGSFRVPTPQEFDASIPPRVVGVLRKCLAWEPEKRYADAGLLALDLRRSLVELPSADPAKRAPPGGSGSRRKRQNRPAAMIVLVGLAVAMLGVAAVRFWSRGDQGTAGQLAGRGSLAGPGPLQRQRIADELHTLVDRLRFSDGLDSLPADRLRKLEAGCREVWQGRARLTDHPTAPLAPEIEQRVRTDVLDLAILWADLHVRLAPAEQRDQARREALRALTQAEAEFGSSVVLSRERQAYAEALGLSEEARRAVDAAAQLEPHTVWEHYAVGRSLLRAGTWEAAAVEFQRGVDLEPQAFWPNFYAGICAYRLQQYEAALASFSACVALAPEKVECFYNRGLAYRAVGREDLAARDFENAKRLDPSFDIDRPRALCEE